MYWELAAASEKIALNPFQSLGIPLALVAAIFLSLGAQFQHRGVNKVDNVTQAVSGGLHLRQLLALFRRPSWVLGTLLIFLAIALQLMSLGLAPLLVVQPLGAVALVTTAILNSRISKIPLNRGSVLAVLMCVSGVGFFVIIAAFTAVDKPVTDENLITILGVLTFALVAFVAVFLGFRKRMRAVAYIVGAGVLYGFVATLAKVVISRFIQEDFNWLTLSCLVGLLIAAGAGAYCVQTAYASGPPDLVIAGLTVVDPLIAVGIGIVVLGEASQAPPLALLGFVLTGMLAIFGVFGLSKHHPQSKR